MKKWMKICLIVLCVVLVFEVLAWVLGVVAFQAYGLGVAYGVNYIDAVASLLDAETLAGKNFLVTFGVQFGETGAEFKLVAVYHNGAVGTFFALHCVGWQKSGNLILSLPAT